MNKKVILQLLPALNTGGVENEVMQLSILAKLHNFDVIVVSAGGSKVSELSAYNIKHIKLKIGSKNILYFICNIFYLHYIIKKNAINIVHVHSRVPAWCLYFAKIYCNIKIITTIHGAYSISSAIKKMYNSIMLKADKIISVSNYIKNYISTNYDINKQVQTVHCGVNTDYFKLNIIDNNNETFVDKYKIPQDKPIILLPGRIVKTKGHDLLIECLKILPKNSVTCVILGNPKADPTYIDSLKNKVKQYTLTNRVLFIKAIDNIKMAYKSADIIISPSIKPEAFGLTLIEAMAMQKIVIASNIGGAKEIITDNENGKLFATEDILNLKQNILDVIKMTQHERDLMGKKARDHIIKNFSIDSKNDKMLKIYRDI